MLIKPPKLSFKMSFLTKEEQNKIIAAIADAERQTSGEIKVHIEAHCKTEPIQRAIQVFEELKMHATEQRNGVLIYLASKDHKFAIIGDKGINEKVGEGFWSDVKSIMQTKFKQQDFVLGLCDGIKLSGEKLKQFFPYQSNDKNELSNEISTNS